MNKQVLFTASMLAVAVGHLALALQMPRGSLAFPGPGFYPSLVGLFMVVSAGVCLALAVMRQRQLRRGAETDRTVPATPATMRPVLQLLGLLLLYIVALPYAGFLPAISVFVLLTMRVFGYKHWIKSLLFTVLVVAASYLVFVHWLAVPLPRGFLDAYL